MAQRIYELVVQYFNTLSWLENLKAEKFKVAGQKVNGPVTRCCRVLAMLGSRP